MPAVQKKSYLYFWGGIKLEVKIHDSDCLKKYLLLTIFPEPPETSKLKKVLKCS